MKDGFKNYCRVCAAARAKKWRAENKERVRENRNRWAAENPQRIKEMNKTFQEKHSEKIKQSQKLYYSENSEAIKRRVRAQTRANPQVRQAYKEKNSDRIRQVTRANYEANAEQRRAYAKAYRLVNLEKCKAAGRQDKIKNRARYTAAENNRKALKLKCSPRWLTESQKAEISALYAYAAEMREAIGEEMHVDHIIPLQGADVCGLHVPWNLQVLRGSDNNEKYNKIPEYLQGWRRPDGSEFNS